MDSIYFKVGLSNGETAVEGKGKFALEKGALSPISKLLKYCADESLRMTSVTICTPDGHEFHAPTSSKNPKFKAFSESMKPVGYKIYRKAGGDVLTGNVKYEHYTVVETLYDGFSLQLWVSHKKPYQSYSLMKEQENEQ